MNLPGPNQKLTPESRDDYNSADCFFGNPIHDAIFQDQTPNELRSRARQSMSGQ